MANSYDAANLSVDDNKVRLLISDTETADGKYIFEDEEIAALLEMEGEVILAAARALEVIAANEVLVQKRITILDLKTDGPSESKELRELAKSWRDRFDLADDSAGFEIAEMVHDEFSYRTKLLNELLREYA